MDYTPIPCKECGTVYTPRRHDQLFCSKQCKTDDQNRALVRGKEAYRAIYHWVLSNGRGDTGYLIGEIGRLGRRWRDADREAGRQAPPLPECERARLRAIKMKGRRNG